MPKLYKKQKNNPVGVLGLSHQSTTLSSKTPTGLVLLVLFVQFQHFGLYGLVQLVLFVQFQRCEGFVTEMLQLYK